MTLRNDLSLDASVMALTDVFSFLITMNDLNCLGFLTSNVKPLSVGIELNIRSFQLTRKQTKKVNI